MNYPHIRTYGRIRGRNEVCWPFDIHAPPDWFHPRGHFSPDRLCTTKPVILEVGFGMGDSLYAMAAEHPGWHFVGVEIYEPGVLRLAKLMSEKPRDNLSIIQADVFDVLASLKENSLHRIHVFFPDPWPKLRHRKRRLHHGPFFGMCESVLNKKGRLHLATDIPSYAEDWSACAPTHWQAQPDDPWIAWRKQTKYEHRGARLGHTITDIVLEIP